MIPAAVKNFNSGFPFFLQGGVGRFLSEKGRDGLLTTSSASGKKIFCLEVNQPEAGPDTQSL